LVRSTPANRRDQRVVYLAVFQPGHRARQPHPGCCSSKTTAPNSSANRLGFALALWDLAGDDGNLSSGLQHFTGDAFGFSMDDGEMIDLVATQAMLDATVGATLHNTYKYTPFTGSTDGGITNDSQAMLSVSAVPEADTWAMMVVGLGLRVHGPPQIQPEREIRRLRRL
jgi:hypothetical protein